MDNKAITSHDRSEKLLAKLDARNIDVKSCFQCTRCAAGCPIGDFFDLSVMEIVRLASYGVEERLLNAKTIWLCAACETCATRCPNEIEIAELMDVLRELAIRKNITPAEPRVPLFHQSFLKTVEKRGRVWELGMVAEYKMKSGDFTSDAGLGMKMFSKGKLKLLPPSIRDRQAVKEIFSGKGKEYDR